MRRLFQFLLLLLGSCVAFPPSLRALDIGDPAPALEVKEFLKGQPITRWEPGKVYIVEFWATWCGPCRATIPHLTALQRKYPDATFIGVCVYEKDANAVKAFIKDAGDKMDYRIALDAALPASAHGEGKMATTWMEAAGEQGIPSAFIINRDGAIAWIGPPSQLDRVLPAILAGSWDVKRAAAQRKQLQARRQQIKELAIALQKARQAKDYHSIVGLIDKAITSDPELEKPLAIHKFNALAAQPDGMDQAIKYGHRLTDSVYSDNARGLNILAWTILTQEKTPKPASIDLALTAAQRAHELTHAEDASIMDTLAKAYYLKGDAAKALRLQEQVMKRVQGTPLEKNPALKQRLQQYQEAATKEPVSAQLP